MTRLRPVRALVPLVYMVGVFFLSSLPGSELRRLGLTALLADFVHLPLFAGLAWATLWAVQGPVLPRLLWVGAACLAFAVSDELHQTLVPGRYFSLRDLAADTVGVGFGIAVGLWAWPGPSRRGKAPE